ncbi:hypothetical protein HCH_02456 [Hahella chejuensis KCTC 2396]|uniref:Uncharacterized protein n=1 Tax=Hahella chejuensis (strain KCTC 2396) TaxID=349521 RepID=Q2SJB2_HAHCH|nr:hypothetical protein HCH_02456 [Hahella chejuensis KCTC 2396]
MYRSFLWCLVLVHRAAFLAASPMLRRRALGALCDGARH